MSLDFNSLVKFSEEFYLLLIQVLKRRLGTSSFNGVFLKN